MATPIDEANRRGGSRVEFSATTAKTTSPGWRYFTPSLRASSLQLGGKIDETRTRFWAAIPASRNANSNEVSRSRCFPTPLVKKIRFGTMSLPNSRFLHKESGLLGMHNLTQCFVKEMGICRRDEKKCGERWRVPASCPDILGGGPGRNSFILRSGRRGRDTLLLLHSIRLTNLNAGTVYRAGDGGLLARLLIEHRQHSFVAGFKDVYLIAHDQRVF